MVTLSEAYNIEYRRLIRQALTDGTQARALRWVEIWGDIVKVHIKAGHAAQAGGDATIAFRLATAYLDA